MQRPKPSPIHPGEILQEEFLVPLGISQYRVAKETSVAHRRINDSVRGTRAITADTALLSFALFRNVGAVLAQFANAVRPGARKGPVR